ncbi:MAG: radical SAM protein [Desulfurococcaceae archaeon]
MRPEDLLRPIGRFRDGRMVYRVEEGAPPFGYIAFGVIDRGTNVVQVRPTTICPQSCGFCSVDAGPFSARRWAEYVVDLGVVVRGVREAVRVKGAGVEALIDTIGDPLTYPELPALVRKLKEAGAARVALETHGALLTRRVIERLWESGLDRVNFSIETLDPEKARQLYGVRWYDLSRAIDAIEYAARDLGMDIHVTSVWLPGVNDEDLRRIAEWAYRSVAGRVPPFTIQKYVVHKYGRRMPGVRPVSWKSFWRQIERWEREWGVRLRWSMEEWGMRYARRVEAPLRRGDEVEATIVGRGWLRGECLALAPTRPAWWVAIRGPCRGRVTAKIVRDKDGLLLGKALGIATS